MKGLVLCGGQSTRMGTDKGLLQHESEIWVQLAFDKLSFLNISAVISINKAQLSSYSTIFSANQLIVDSEVIQLKGPLLGVLSAHVQFPNEPLFVLACDMPLMETTLLKQLQEAFFQYNECDSFVFTNNHEPEPLCGIYNPSGLSTILTMYQSNQLTKHSMKFVLERTNTYTISLQEDQKKYFRNFNAHAELNGL